MRKIVEILICGFLLATGSAVAAESAKMLVFPLSGTQQGGGAWVGDGVALSLSEQLAGFGIRVLSRGDLEDLLDENGLPIGVSLSRGSMMFVAGSAGADFAVIGNFTGNFTGDDGNLKLSARTLTMENLKFSSEFTVSGAVTTLREMENELAWMIYGSIGAPQNLSREKFRERTRKPPNAPYASYIQSLRASSETEQLRLLEKAVKDYPDFTEAHLQMGRLYYQNRDYEDALTHLQYGRKIPGTRLWSDFLTGTCFLQSGRTADAVKTYTQILNWARRPAVLNNLAIAHIRGGDYTSALHALLEAREAAPTDSTIAMNLAVTRYLVGNAQAAVDSLQDALKMHPGNGMLYFVSSFLMEAVGNESRAAEDAAKATRLGIRVEELQQEEPKTWMRVIPNWTGDEDEGRATANSPETP
ncbi:MAG: tetratricopeptide repeat protein [Acidobacteriota bacterium]|nr:tetratricopeptide repeat protein [Acidobacteriota bacterium]